MSLHASLVMVNADVRGEAARIFGEFGYQPASNRLVESWEQALEAMDYRPGQNVVRKAVLYLDGWTVFLDPEMVMCDEAAVCEALARRHSAPVFTMVCAGSSGSYGYSYYAPQLQRSLQVSDGEVLEDEGEALPQEQGIAANKLGENDVLTVMQRIGISFDAIAACGAYDVWEFDEPGMPAKAAPARKPWWKFW